MPDVRPAAPCPRCSATLTSVGEEPEWCPECEWNLGDLGPQPSRLRRRLDSYAFEVDERVAAELTGCPPHRPHWSAGRAALLAVSVVLGTGVLALFVTGLVLLVTASLMWKVAGLLLVLMAVELRPRLPRLGAVLGLVTRVDQPALFAAVDRLCRELGAPRIHEIVLDESFEASCTRYGLRRRPVLSIGLPLWAALTPTARVAMLTHQLAHLVDGDPGSGLLARPALSTFGNLARIFDPRGVVRRHQLEPHGAYDGAITSRTNQSVLFFEWFANAVSAVLFAPLTWLCTTIQFLLQAMTARGRRRAEYYADALAVQIAGTDAAIEHLETLVLAEPVSTAVHRWLRVGADVSMLQAEAQEARERHRREQRRAEQRSIRSESDVLAEHPAPGRRLRVVRSWPVLGSSPVVAEVDHAAIDAQLAPAYRRVGRALAYVL